MKVCALILLLLQVVAANDIISVGVGSDFLMCRNVENIIGNVERKIQGVTEFLPVIKGERGEKGLKGSVGLKGPDGPPTQKQVNDLIIQRMTDEADHLYILEKLVEKALATLSPQTEHTVNKTKEVEDLQRDQQCMDKFKAPIGDKTQCYRFIGGQDILYSRKIAGDICCDMGGHLADVATKEMYTKLFRYVDETYRVTINAWTGMTRKDNKVNSVGEGEVNYTRALSFHSDEVGLKVIIDSSQDNYIYLESEDVNRAQHYAVCQFDLDLSTVNRTAEICAKNKEDLQMEPLSPRGGGVSTRGYYYRKKKK